MVLSPRHAPEGHSIQENQFTVVFVMYLAREAQSELMGTCMRQMLFVPLVGV